MTDLSPLNLGYNRKEVGKAAIPQYPTLADRPTAAAFGVGMCQIGSTVYVSDGVIWRYINLIGYQTIPYSLIDTTDNAADYTLTGSVTEDATVAASSTKTLKFNATAGAGNVRIQRDTSLQLTNDTVNSPLLLSFYIPNIAASDSNQSQMEVWLSNQTALGAGNRSQVQLSNAVTLGWNTVPIEKATVNTNPYAKPAIQNGTAAVNFASPILSYRLDVIGGAVDRTKYWDGLLEGYRERPKVCITFDDNNTTGYTVGYLEAKKRNLCTSHFLIFDLIGAVNYATLSQLQQMARDPLCYLGLHGQFRFDGAGSGAGRDPYTEIKRNIDGLKALSLSDCAYVAWPEGQYAIHDKTLVIDRATALGVIGGRATLQQHQFFRAHNPMTLRSVGLNSNTTLAQAKLAVDYAISWGCSVSFYGHNFAAVADATTWVTSDYVELLDYIALKRSYGLIDDLRFDDYASYGRSLNIAALELT